MGSDLTDPLRQEHGWKTVMAADGEPSIVMMSEQERREEAADLIDAIDALHRLSSEWCVCCAEPWPCATHRLIRPEANDG